MKVEMVGILYRTVHTYILPSPPFPKREREKEKRVLSDSYRTSHVRSLAAGRDSSTVLVQCPREVSSLMLLILLPIYWQMHIVMRQIATFVLV